MRLLLDTHILLWALTDSAKLPARGWDFLSDEGNALVVSAVSIWEIAIKHARNRGALDDMPLSGSQAHAEVRAADFDLLAVTLDHAAAVDRLPLHHRDPFDRLLIAQAQTEPMILLTQDTALAAYGERVLLV